MHAYLDTGKTWRLGTRERFDLKKDLDREVAIVAPSIVYRQIDLPCSPLQQASAPRLTVEWRYHKTASWRIRRNNARPNWDFLRRQMVSNTACWRSKVHKKCSLVAGLSITLSITGCKASSISNVFKLQPRFLHLNFSAFCFANWPRLSSRLQAAPTPLSRASTSRSPGCYRPRKRDSCRSIVLPRKDKAVRKPANLLLRGMVRR